MMHIGKKKVPKLTCMLYTGIALGTFTRVVKIVGTVFGACVKCVALSVCELKSSVWEVSGWWSCGDCLVQEGRRRNWPHSDRPLGRVRASHPPHTWNSASSGLRGRHWHHSFQSHVIRFTMNKIDNTLSNLAFTRWSFISLDTRVSFISRTTS